MTRLEEINAKLDRVRGFMAERGVAGVLLGTQANFAWITAGGDSHVGLSSEGGVATVLVTRDGRHVFTTNIEGERIASEEIADLGFELHADLWHQTRLDDAIRRLVGPGEVLADHDAPGAANMAPEIARLRWQLLMPEIERYRQVGQAAVAVLAEVAWEVSPGMSELEIAGLMAGRCFSLGLLPNVCLVAADERAFRYRHPIPTDRQLERHLMLVTGVRRWGLAVSATRMVHFGAIPEALAAKHRAVCAVDACFILGSRPGAKVGELFRAACEEYGRQGYPDEWRLHHQGGATGYAPRDYKATADSTEVVVEGQAFAWNPSIAGTKSEDTTVASADGPEILSPCRNWPALSVCYEGQALERPDILER